MGNSQLKLRFNTKKYNKFVRYCTAIGLHTVPLERNAPLLSPGQYGSS